MRLLPTSILAICTFFLMPNLAIAELSFGFGFGHIASEKVKQSDIFALLTGTKANNLDHFSQDNTDIAFRLFGTYEYEN
jgi:hypothetical protein